MNSFYFTFGKSHPYHNQCQQIVAENKSLAKKQMCEVFGDNWLHCYTQEEFESYIRRGHYRYLNPLPPIYENCLI